MAAQGSRYFDRQQSERRWPSFLFSLGITAVLFASAFGAMRSLPKLVTGGQTKPSTSTIVLQLPAPAEPAPVVARSRVRPTERPPIEKRRDEPAALPDVAPPAASQIAVPIGVPGTQPAARDSGGASPSSVSGASTNATSARRGSGKGAPIAPAGISLDNRAANTPYVRDSIVREKMVGIPDLARTRAPTGREKQELEASQRQAAALRQRSTTAGNSRDLTILQGSGMNGVGAVGGPGIVSIPLPLFSSGPSPEQRKKNEKIDADYQMRLRRLEDRMYLKRDSIRADSVRADSLRRDSLALSRRQRRPPQDTASR
jgi:hypothetical protein